jgi:hypothetical protein
MSYFSVRRAATPGSLPVPRYCCCRYVNQVDLSPSQSDGGLFRYHTRLPTCSSSCNPHACTTFTYSRHAIHHALEIPFPGLLFIFWCLYSLRWACVSAFSCLTRVPMSYLCWSEWPYRMFQSYIYLFCVRNVTSSILWSEAGCLACGILVTISVISTVKMVYINCQFRSSRSLVYYISAISLNVKHSLLVETMNCTSSIKILNSVPLVRKRTSRTERPPLVGEVSANFSG